MTKLSKQQRWFPVSAENLYSIFIFVLILKENFEGPRLGVWFIVNPGQG